MSATSAAAQVERVSALLARLSELPYTPGRQAEFEAARQLLRELRAEAREDAGSLPA